MIKLRGCYREVINDGQNFTVNGYLIFATEFTSLKKDLNKILKTPALEKGKILKEFFK